MPAKKQKKNASRIVNMRAHLADVRMIDQAAKIEGKTRSTFLVDSARYMAMRVFESTGRPCPTCGYNTKERHHGSE